MSAKCIPGREHGSARAAEGAWRAGMAEFFGRSLGIVLLGFLLNLPWEVLQMAYNAAAPHGLAIALRSHLGPSLGDALVILAIYWLGALLFGHLRWSPGWDPRRWGFLLGTGGLAASGIEWRALYVKQAWAYSSEMPRVPGLDVGLLPVLQMLLLPAATLAVVQAVFRWGLRAVPSHPAAAAREPSMAGVVLTPQGKVARYFYGVEYSLRDLRLGLGGASAGKIGSPVDQMLLSCYHYGAATGKYTVMARRGRRQAGNIEGGAAGTPRGRSPAASGCTRSLRRSSSTARAASSADGKESRKSDATKAMAEASAGLERNGCWDAHPVRGTPGRGRGEGGSRP